MVDSVALRVWRLAPRKARLDIRGSVVSLYLPTYFGRRRWELNADQVAVADLEQLVDTGSDGGTEPDVVYRSPVTVPYLFTTGPYTSPNLLILFASRSRVPPLRLLPVIAPNVELPFGFWSSRSESGDLADGVMLRAVDPAAAVDRLVAAGAVRTDDSDTWLVEHRDLVIDPDEREQLMRREAVQSAS